MSLLGAATRLALGTLTVLPVRPPRRVDRAVAGLAMVLAPLVVLPLAAAAATAAWLGDAAGMPPLPVAVIVVTVLAVGSGFLHLDGLADTADGLAVPGDRDRALQVMRTGDVGPVGAVTLLLVVLIQVSALAEVIARSSAGATAATIVMAVLVSRAALTLACVRGVPAARSEGLGSAVAGTVSRRAALLVGLLALLVVAAGGAVEVLDSWHAFAGIAVAAALVALLLVRAGRRLGGVTGDVLGACVELSLAAYLLTQVVAPG